MKKVQRSEDLIEVLELDEVAHTANPNPRRSTRNRSRKLIINEDKKNEEEGNEAQGKENEGEEAVDKETMEGENYEVINPNEENVTEDQIEIDGHEEQDEQGEEIGFDLATENGYDKAIRNWSRAPLH